MRGKYVEEYVRQLIRSLWRAAGAIRSMGRPALGGAAWRPCRRRKSTSWNPWKSTTWNPWSRYVWGRGGGKITSVWGSPGWLRVSSEWAAGDWVVVISLGRGGLGIKTRQSNWKNLKLKFVPEYNWQKLRRKYFGYQLTVDTLSLSLPTM